MQAKTCSPGAARSSSATAALKISWNGSGGTRATKLRQRCLPPPPQCGRRCLASAVFLSWPYLDSLLPVLALLTLWKIQMQACSLSNRADYCAWPNGLTDSSSNLHFTLGSKSRKARKSRETVVCVIALTIRRPRLKRSFLGRAQNTHYHYCSIFFFFLSKLVWTYLSFCGYHHLLAKYITGWTVDADWIKCVVAALRYDEFIRYFEMVRDRNGPST